MRKIGIEHFHIILIKYVSCENREELLREERNEYDKINKNFILNKNLPYIYKNEYYKNNRNKIIQINIKSEIKNKKRVREYKKKYYEIKNILK